MEKGAATSGIHQNVQLVLWQACSVIETVAKILFVATRAVQVSWQRRTITVKMDVETLGCILSCKA